MAGPGRPSVATLLILSVRPIFALLWSYHFFPPF